MVEAVLYLVPQDKCEVLCIEAAARRGLRHRLQANRRQVHDLAAAVVRATRRYARPNESKAFKLSSLGVARIGRINRGCGFFYLIGQVG